VFLWFIGLSFAVIWIVFQSPAVDYRTVMVGSVVPLVDLVVPGTRPIAHTLGAAAIAFGVVILATMGQRLRRRRWLGIPIGWFLHLGLDGTWTDAQLFWWPFLGLDDGITAPESGRSIVLIVVMEIVGLLVLIWAWRRFALSDVQARRQFWRDGRLA